MFDEPELFVELNRHLIIWGICFFNIIGNAGNVALIYITVRSPDVQTKSGLLLLVTACSHIMCCLSELVNVFFLASQIPVIRRTCAYLIFPYMFFINQQSVMALVLVLDLLLAICRPFWYQKCNTRNYIFLICLPANLVGMIFSVVALVEADDQIIEICNPPLVLIPSWGRVFSLGNVIMNTLVIILYVVTMGLMKCRETTENSKQIKSVQRRLSVSVLVYIFSWYSCLLGVDLINLFDLPEFIKNNLKSDMVFFALICYSQTFYVCLWRSEKFRLAAKRVIGLRNHSSLNSISPSKRTIVQSTF